MGYILPIQSIQSQQYANRLQIDNYDFAHINAVQPIKMKSLFEDELEQREKRFNGDEESTQKSNIISYPVPYIGFIQPNPINLSPEIAKLNGKGNQINTYI